MLLVVWLNNNAQAGKNLATKDNLGIEFMGGWDIFNVAQALSLPRSWRKKSLRGS